MGHRGRHPILAQALSTRHCIRVVKNYTGSLLPGYPTGTHGSPTSMNLNVNVNSELRQSHAQLHMHHRLTRYIIIATIYKLSHKVNKLMGHGSTPSNPWPMWPIRFSWPIWPMTHDPSTHSLLWFPATDLRRQVESLHLLHMRKHYCHVWNKRRWTDFEFAWTYSCEIEF